MSWICPKCGINNVNANERCARHNCGVVRPETSKNEDDEFDQLCREVRQYEINCTTKQYLSTTIPEINVVNIISAIFTRNRETGANIMTPQEELFSQLFNHEKLLVKDMEILELRAHREELAKIAFEARARLTAVDDEENTRKKKRSDGKPTGFERSLNTDETSTNAINTIKDRQKRMSKAEKIQAGLEKLGISTADAEKLMSAGTILGRIKNAKGLIESKTEQTENKPIFNPFEKKEG